MATSLGQGPLWRGGSDTDVGDGELASEPVAVAPAVSDKAGLSPWRRIEIGLEEAFEEFRRATQTKTPFADGPAANNEHEMPDLAPRAGQPVSTRPIEKSDRSAIVDAAINALAASYSVTPVLPALRFADPEGMPNNRHEPGLLAPTALVLLFAGRRRTGRCNWRTSKNDKPGQIPHEDA